MNTQVRLGLRPRTSTPLSAPTTTVPACILTLSFPFRRPASLFLPIPLFLRSDPKAIMMTSYKQDLFLLKYNQ